jgi:hypothetical protein
MIGKKRWKSSRKFVWVLVFALLLASAGCGGDDEEAPATTPVATTPTETQPAPETETGAPTETEPPFTESPDHRERHEEAEGGDEEPARTLALFTGRGGRITPPVVRVPAFISVRVELRSADGATYELHFGDVGLKSGGPISSHGRTIDGLRPNESIVGVPRGMGNRVRIEATAEPGP